MKHISTGMGIAMCGEQYRGWSKDFNGWAVALEDWIHAPRLLESASCEGCLQRIMKMGESAKSALDQVAKTKAVKVGGG